MNDQDPDLKVAAAIASTIGWQAFLAGRPEAPAADRGFMTAVADSRNQLTLLHAFRKGWQDAQTAAAFAKQNGITNPPTP